MSIKPRFTWGDSVVVDGDRAGEVCAITETEDSFHYTVEFPDGTDELINEKRLEPGSEQES